MLNQIGFATVTCVSLDLEAKTHIEMECEYYRARPNPLGVYRLLDVHQRLRALQRCSQSSHESNYLLRLWLGQSQVEGR